MNEQPKPIDSKYFKSTFIETRAQYLHPHVYRVLGEMCEWLEAKGQVPVITETVTTLKEDAALKRKSAAHREGRGADIRTRGWSEELIKLFRFTFNKLYGQLGALAPMTLEPTLLVHHDTGSGPHFHIQFNTKFRVKLPAVLEPVEMKEKA